MILVVDWLWQGLAVAAAAAVLLACARRLDAASRCAVWWSAGTAVVALPLASIVLRWPVSNAPTDDLASDAAFVMTPPPDWILTAGLTLWGLFALWQFVRIAISIRTAASLVRGAQPLDDAIVSRLTRTRAAGARGRRFALRVCDAPIGACAIGPGSPVILVSRSLIEALTPEELDAVVMHEHAHLERRDDRSRILQTLVGAVAGWHPALWFIGRGIDLEREAACDERVVSRTNTPRTYARALVRAAEARCAPAAVGLVAPAAFGSASMLRRRVGRLTDPSWKRDGRQRLRTGALLGPALAAAAALVSCSPALVAFVEMEMAHPNASSSPPGAAAPPMPHLMETTPTLLSREPHARGVSNQRWSTGEDERTIVPVAAATIGALQAASAGGPTSPVPSDVEAPAPLPSSPLPVVKFTSAAAPPAAPDTAAANGWGALTRAASAAGTRAGAAGAATGGNARDAGLSIGRFFTRTAKGIAGQF